MADCSKTTEFLREYARMCKDESDCTKCPLKKIGDGSYCLDRVGKDPDKAVSIVQKWSDENTAMTWAGKLREMLPNADIDSIIESGCPHEYFGSVAPIPGGYCTVLCAECWNSEYKEAEK